MLREVTNVSNRWQVYGSLLVFIVGGTLSLGKPPSELPGEEITEEQYFDFVVPRDSIASKVPEGSPYSETWLDQAAKTWDAPPLAVQIAEDKEKILMGKGAVFIPYISDPALEPDIEVMDPMGNVVASGKPGRKYCFVPGTYHVMLGSGPHKQRIVRTVEIIENELVPVVPNWCGLSIEVVDEDNQPFRGEYEIARIDKFVPYGRGFGRNPDLGEEVKTWILKPGIYKIFGVGESYNTLTNFLTVRLLPGEYVRLVLVQKDETSMEIIGGGQLQLTPGSEIATNWKYGIDVGGGVDFNMTYNHMGDSTDKNETALSLILRSMLTYKKNKVDWENRLRISEEVRVTDLDLAGLSNSVDEVQLRSIFTWHFFPWFGPYSRFEINTELFPEYEHAPEGKTHYFIIFDEEYKNPSFNVSDSSYKMQNSFSPFTIEPGIGANLTMPSTRFVEGKLLTGIGLKYNKIWDQSELIDSGDIKWDQLNDTVEAQLNNIINDSKFTHTLIRKFNDKSEIEVGPEVILFLLFYLGRWAVVETEIEYFAPFERIERPDLSLRSTLSWRLIRILTLDYEFEYTLKQPYEEAFKKNESRHRILLRFSYTKR